jgi:hypothetical protein
MARTADAALADVLFFAGKRAPATDPIPSRTVSAGTLPVLERLLLGGGFHSIDGGVPGCFSLIRRLAQVPKAAQNL